MDERAQYECELEIKTLIYGKASFPICRPRAARCTCSCTQSFGNFRNFIVSLTASSGFSALAFSPQFTSSKCVSVSFS